MLALCPFAFGDSADDAALKSLSAIRVNVTETYNCAHQTSTPPVRSAEEIMAGIRQRYLQILANTDPSSVPAVERMMDLDVKAQLAENERLASQSQRTCVDLEMLSRIETDTRTAVESRLKQAGIRILPLSDTAAPVLLISFTTHNALVFANAALLESVRLNRSSEAVIAETWQSGLFDDSRTESGIRTAIGAVIDEFVGGRACQNVRAQR